MVLVVRTLDRTQPSLSLKPGRAGSMTHYYKRHGTADLFAGMNVATGEVTRHSHVERRTKALTCSSSSS